MKTIAVRDLQKKIRECVDLAQKEKVIITRHHAARTTCRHRDRVEGRDWEDMLLQRSESFWKLTEARRKESTITLGEMRKRAGAARTRRQSKR